MSVECCHCWIYAPSFLCSHQFQLPLVTFLAWKCTCWISTVPTAHTSICRVSFTDGGALGQEGTLAHTGSLCSALAPPHPEPPRACWSSTFTSLSAGCLSRTQGTGPHGETETKSLSNTPGTVFLFYSYSWNAVSLSPLLLGLPIEEIRSQVYEWYKLSWEGKREGTVSYRERIIPNSASQKCYVTWNSRRGFPNYPQVEHIYESFPEPKWCKAKRQLPFIYIEIILSITIPYKNPL